MPKFNESDKKRDLFTIRLTKKEKEKLRKYAEENGITMTEAIQRFIKGLNID